MPEAKKWIDQYKDVSGFEYFGNTRYQYPFIADEFKDKIDWDIKQIRILTIDIECESENGFPNSDEAIEPLNINYSKRTYNKEDHSLWYE